MIAFDVTRQVGQGNTFLTHPHTVKYCNQIFFPDKSKLAWEATLSNKMVAEAKTVVKKTLKEHVVPQLDKDTIRQGDEIISQYEKSLTET